MFFISKLRLDSSTLNVNYGVYSADYPTSNIDSSRKLVLKIMGSFIISNCSKSRFSYVNVFLIYVYFLNNIEPFGTTIFEIEHSFLISILTELEDSNGLISLSLLELVEVDPLSFFSVLD